MTTTAASLLFLHTIAAGHKRSCGNGLYESNPADFSGRLFFFFLAFTSPRLYIFFTSLSLSIAIMQAFSRFFFLLIMSDWRSF